MDTNAVGSSAAGASEARIAAVERWRESDEFGPAERAALALAEAATATPAEVPDEVFAEARRHFSERQLVELAATVALENYRARLNRVFAVESQGFYGRRTQPSRE